MSQRMCASCGAPLAGRQRKWCNEACRMREFFRQWSAEHGEPYTARYRDQRRASDRVRYSKLGTSQRQRYPDSAKAADQRRRVRLAGGQVERFDSSEIFERDGWRCGICGKKVDSRRQYPDPMSASLDHIVPVVDGGDHTRANSRCAHLRCNIQRGTGGADEQLRLVG